MLNDIKWRKIHGLSETVDNGINIESQPFFQHFLSRHDPSRIADQGNG